MTQSEACEQFTPSPERSTLARMPLAQPRRLPKRFRRRASGLSRYVALRSTGLRERRSRQRRERWIRMMRRIGQLRAFILAECKLWLIIGSLATLALVVGALLFAPLFDVREIRIRRQDARIDPERVQQALHPLFSRRLVLVTRSNVSSLLAEQYPDLKEVTIAKDYPSTLIVSLVLDPVVAHAVVMDDATDAGSGTTLDAYITSRGLFVLSPIPIVTREPLETLTLTDWVVRPQDRTLVLEPAVLRTIILARDTLRRDFGLSPSRIVYYMRAREFHIATERGTLWFDLQSELGVQFGRLREFLKTTSFDAVKEYVDLRIADRVVYR